MSNNPQETPTNPTDAWTQSLLEEQARYRRVRNLKPEDGETVPSFWPNRPEINAVRHVDPSGNVTFQDPQTNNEIHTFLDNLDDRMPAVLGAIRSYAHTLSEEGCAYGGVMEILLSHADKQLEEINEAIAQRVGRIQIVRVYGGNPPYRRGRILDANLTPASETKKAQVANLHPNSDLK